MLFPLKCQFTDPSIVSVNFFLSICQSGKEKGHGGLCDACTETIVSQRSTFHVESIGCGSIIVFKSTTPTKNDAASQNRNKQAEPYDDLWLVVEPHKVI